MSSFQVVFDFGVARFSYVVQVQSPLSAIYQAEQLMVVEHGLHSDGCKRVVVCLV